MKRDHLTLIAVSAVCLSLCGAPLANAAIRKVVDADTVDGKHAISATAKSADRRGKLVAFSKRNGLLPNNIISSAPNSQRLGGNPPSYFLPATGTAANANRLGGLTAASFLGVGAKAADSDKLDGHDSSEFVLVGALPRGGYSTMRSGQRVTILTGTPAVRFTCGAATSTLAIGWGARPRGLSPIFWQARPGVRRTAAGPTGDRFALSSVRDGSGHTAYAWHDRAGTHRLSVSYTYGAGRCAVLAQETHAR